MNEKLISLLSTVQRGTVRAEGVLSDAAYGARQKARKCVSAVRGGLRAAELERETDARLRELGELLYATHTGRPTDSEVLLEKLREIDALRAELREINRAPERR